MYRAFDAYAPAGQVIAPNSIINFTVDYDKWNNGIDINNGVISIRYPGAYLVNANININPTDTGLMTLQLYKGDIPISGSVASANVTSGETYNFSLNKVISVLGSCPCIQNTTQLSIRVIAGEGTVASGNISIIQ